MSVKTVEELCLRFELSPNLRSECLKKWMETSTDNSFICSSKRTKTILSAICVYITLLQHNRPYTITQICGIIGCNTCQFGKVLTQVIKTFPLYKTESVPIEELVGVTLTEANFDEHERQLLNDRVIDIIVLSRKCWLIEGRSPVHIIFGAAFLAWKSLKPNLRAKVKLTQFCNIVGIDYKHTTSERVTEIFNALKTLAKKIPGKQNFKFTKNNISIYLNDILKYRNSLLFDLNQQIKSKNTKDDHKSIEWMNTFKRKGYEPSEQDKKPSEHETKQKITKINTQSDEEISDSEIDCYIRSKKEVKLIKRLKKMVENDEEEAQEEPNIQIEDFIEVEGIDY